MRVEVYRNLHTGGYSLRDAKTRLVIAHEDYILLENCEFIVWQGGRKRVLKERCKNVHAFIRGQLLATGKEAVERIEGDLLPITYDPYKYSTFVWRDGEGEVGFSERVALIPGGAMAKPF